MRVCKGVCAMEKCRGGIIGACKQGVQQAGCHPAPPPGTPAVSALESQARAWGGGASAPAPQGRPPLDLWGPDRWVRAHESEHGGATVVAPAMAPALPQTAVQGGGACSGTGTSTFGGTHDGTCGGTLRGTRSGTRGGTCGGTLDGTRAAPAPPTAGLPANRGDPSGCPRTGPPRSPPPGLAAPSVPCRGLDGRGGSPERAPRIAGDPLLSSPPAGPSSGCAHPGASVPPPALHRVTHPRGLPEGFGGCRGARGGGSECAQ